jgi:GNAT superfamily N-acetyltransferase
MKITTLDGDRREFAALTFPSLAHQLQDLKSPCVAVGFEAEGAPGGLALGWLMEEGGGEVLSVSVRRELRRRGHGVALLLALEQAMAAQGVSRLQARVVEALPRYKTVERLLARTGWSALEPSSIQVVGKAGFMAAKGGAWRGVEGRLKAPSGFRFTTLDLVPRDDKAIKRLMAQPNWATHVDPRQYALTLDATCSIAIRRGIDIVGWVIAEKDVKRLGPGTTSPDAPSVFYPENYLDETLWSLGLSIGAYFHAFSRQAEAYGPKSLAIYRTHPGAARMLAFTRRRFAPIADRIDTVMMSRKTLEAAAATG